MALPNSNLSQLLNHADKVVWNYFWSIIFFISPTSQMWPSTNACARVLVCVFLLLCVCVILTNMTLLKKEMIMVFSDTSFNDQHKVTAEI